MALPASGQISIDQINTQLQRAFNSACDIGGSAERSLARVVTGQISMSDFWGKPLGLSGFDFTRNGTTSGAYSMQVSITGGSPNTTVNISSSAISFGVRGSWSGFNQNVTLNSSGNYSGTHGSGSRSPDAGTTNHTVSYVVPAAYGGFTGSVTKAI